MAKYDYECTVCGEAVEMTHKMNEPRPPCPNCGGQLRRLINTPAIIFSGDGFTRKPKPPTPDYSKEFPD